MTRDALKSEINYLKNGFLTFLYGIVTVAFPFTDGIYKAVKSITNRYPLSWNGEELKTI